MNMNLFDDQSYTLDLMSSGARCNRWFGCSYDFFSLKLGWKTWTMESDKPQTELREMS